MRHVRPHVAKPVRRGPMATPVKKDKKINFSFTGFREFFIRVIAFIKRRLLLCIIVVVLFFFPIVLFATPVFTIKQISYDFKDSAEDCISRKQIEDSYFKKPPRIWSHLFFKHSSLKKKYPCLDTIAFHWNPFAFNSLTVRIFAAKPVAAVTIVRVDVTDSYGLSEHYFTSPLLGEEVRYLTKEGNLVPMVSPPSLPEFRYIILKNEKLEDIHIAPNDIKTLLQLKVYLESELSVIGPLEFAQDGTIRFSAPFAEEIYVTLHDDMSIQLGSLQAILGTSTIDKKKIRSVDLRFSNPVIHFR